MVVGIVTVMMMVMVMRMRMLTRGQERVCLMKPGGTVAAKD